MRRLLVVDDEAHMTRLLRIGLERAGYEVEIARDGVEALERLEAASFDALVTDVCMPRMNGRELCERIRERFPERRLRIFVASSSTEREHRSWVSALAGVEFLEKPLSLRRLVGRLEAAFASPGRADAEAR